MEKTKIMCMDLRIPGIERGSRLLALELYHPEKIENPDDAVNLVRETCRDYGQTAVGKEKLEDSNGYLYWDDVQEFLPECVQKEHGFRITSCRPIPLDAESPVLEPEKEKTPEPRTLYHVRTGMDNQNLPLCPLPIKNGQEVSVSPLTETEHAWRMQKFDGVLTFLAAEAKETENGIAFRFTRSEIYPAKSRWFQGAQAQLKALADVLKPHDLAEESVLQEFMQILDDDSSDLVLFENLESRSFETLTLDTFVRRLEPNRDYILLDDCMDIMETPNKKN